MRGYGPRASEPGDSDRWDSQIETAAGILGPRAQRGVPLGPLTTYRVGGPAALFVRASSPEDLELVAQARSQTGLPILVVGRGSNLLVADSGFAGMVVILDATAFGWLRINNAGGGALVAPAAAGAGAVVGAGAAVDLPVLARRTAQAGLTGLEWAVGIPGTVGGAVRMNAGGHGGDISQRLRSCRWVDLVSGTIDDVVNTELCFAYRRSAVTVERVVVSAEFEVMGGDRAQSEATIRDIVRWRREHQPGGQNAGSIFTNPPGEPPANSAGWLIEAAGLKGLRRGSAVVSDKHANFIQADPGGSADDVFALIMEVQRLVFERLGVELHPEVRFQGFGSISSSGTG